MIIKLHEAIQLHTQYRQLIIFAPKTLKLMLLILAVLIAIQLMHELTTSDFLPYPPLLKLSIATVKAFVITIILAIFTKDIRDKYKKLAN